MPDFESKKQTPDVISSTKTPPTSWSEQKSRMDAMLAKLKSEIQEVKSMDKDLTRQFISLGGIINQIKAEQLEDDDTIDLEDDIKEDPSDENDEGDDTKL